ncbi:MAG: hypothetical protein ACYTBJ_02325 [Planctomycetota bacterium]|jgi:hypothetical protein
MSEFGKKLIRRVAKPCQDAIEQQPGVWLVPDDVPGLACSKEDVPPRYDLPKGHPLYGKRALRNVTAGMPDIVMSEDGELDYTTKEPEPEPEPVVEETPTRVLHWWER